MPPTTQLDPGFVFRPIPPLDNPIHLPFPALPSPLGPLELLAGTWNGTGFNTIWRPHFPSSPQDRFLELNLTTETLSFNPISGAIPNRGLLQEDMNMFGLTYMQQISDSSSGDGLHIEPGIWAAVPQTADPAEPPTVVRMASIPHGTTILAQGVASVANGGPALPDNNMIPFGIGGTPPPNGDFLPAAQTFTEMDLSVASTFRSLPPSGVTQDMVKNPNSILKAAISGQSIRSTTTLQVGTASTPVPGGGTANTAFLQGTTPNGGNANAAQVDATFWIETIVDPAGGPDALQLQYSQTVMLDFNGLRWPHITVATLRRSLPAPSHIALHAINPDADAGPRPSPGAAAS